MNVFKAKLYEILLYLIEKFNKDTSYGLLNSIRSAIYLISDENLTENVYIDFTRFLKESTNFALPSPNIMKLGTYK